MLTKIILDNFKSFKQATSIDFMKTNYTILPQNVSENGVLKGCLFVGANASGKSTVIYAIKLLLDLLFGEENLHSGLFLCMFGEKLNYSLTYEFLIEQNKILYTFEMNESTSTIVEKLLIEDTILLERMGSFAKSYIADSDGIFYDETDIDENTLFLRTLYFNTKFKSNVVLMKWMDYLKSSVYVNLYEKELIVYNKMDLSVNTYIAKYGCQYINDFFKTYDFAYNIHLEHSFDHIIQEKNFRFVYGDNDTDEGIFFQRKGIQTHIPFPEESLGNKNLLMLLPAFLNVIQNDGMLLIDEFSSGFHNDLEKLLVHHFMEKSNNAQLLFVSHSTNLLSNFLLRPDQIYAVEFHGNDGSSVKRFSSEQPRSAQNIEKMYVSGIFGGLPRYKEVDNETE